MNTTLWPVTAVVLLELSETDCANTLCERAAMGTGRPCDEPAAIRRHDTFGAGEVIKANRVGGCRLDKTEARLRD